MRPMNYRELIEFYRTVPRAAKELGVSRQLLYYWQKNGIPAGRQALIHIKTRGRLRADQPETVPR
jgi:transposase-like protein